MSDNRSGMSSGAEGSNGATEMSAVSGNPTAAWSIVAR